MRRLREPRFQRRGPFDPERRPRLFDLPRELDYTRIRNLIETSWTPSWSHIKDESISEISAAWLARSFLEGAERWQDEAERYANPAPAAPSKQEKEGKARQGIVAVTLELEPLREGDWAVSIAHPSSQPLFDQGALADTRAVASLFPAWVAGYGSALWYRLEATLTILPPLPQIGLSCLFCTPDELKKIEVLYPFKKLMRKDVVFVGLRDPLPATEAAP